MLKTLQDCGDLVLRINQSAFEADADDFQGQVLSEIDRLIGFDRAWWGIMSPAAAGGFDLLSSYRANLPNSYVEKWQTCTSDDRLATSVNDTPMRTVRFGTRDLHSTKGLYEINADVGNKHALCTAVKLPGRGDDFLFVSLFRCGKSSDFHRTEVWAKQFMMPHVYMAWRHNLMHNQERRGVNGAAVESLGAVFVDLGLRVLDANPRFTALMNTVWPAWTPPALPQALADALRDAPDGARAMFNDLAFSLCAAGGLQLLSISAVSALDRLTPRESQVAAAFASGQSYKEVARSLSISPATVRHYLREIYTKLDLTDKVQLANLITHSAAGAYARSPIGRSC